MSARLPEWFDRDLYPFAPHSIAHPAGQMHYVDEPGEGSPIVFVHGNPDWSFSYRHLIAGLRGAHRCIAPDHLGFGLSDKPRDWDYLPASHAENFARLMDALALEDITLVMNDWGGPIALPFALENPERIRALVPMNTWCWAANGDWYYEFFSGFMGGPLGRYLIRHHNLFTRMIGLTLKSKDAKSTAVRRHVTGITPEGADRKGSWVFPKQIIQAGPWLDTQWAKINRLAETPALVLWGMDDFIFIRKEYERWNAALPRSKLMKLNGAGHYPHEDQPEAVIAAIQATLSEKTNT